MKKLYTYLSIGILFLGSFTVSAQVLIDQDFESSSSFPPGWNSGSLPPYVITTDIPCNGTLSARGTLNSSSTSPILNFLSQQATGQDIVISFNYKLLQNVTGNPATNENFGSFELEYTTNGGTTWTSYHTIHSSNHTPSTSCTTLTHTIPAANVPAGTTFGWRVRGVFNQGNNYIYIDNFRAVEQVSCIRPIKITPDTVSFNSIQVSWEDINNPAATEWNVAYCPVGIDPTNPACYISNIDNTTSNPYTITGLDEGTQYGIYVQSVCGPGNLSAWTGPITIQTLAIGTNCDSPLEVTDTDLPFSHSSNTNIYESSYSGSPGVGCIGNNFLQGFDVVYHFTSVDDDILQIMLSDLVGQNNVGVFVYENCIDIQNDCVAGATTNDGSDFGITDFFINGGQDYYIVISTLGAGTSTEYTLEITGFDCALWHVPDGDSDYLFYGQTLGDFDGTAIGVNPTVNGANLIWYEDNNGAPGNMILNPQIIILNNGDIFWVVQTVGMCLSPALEVTFNEFDCLNDLDMPVIVNLGNQMMCGSGSTTLEVSANTNNIYWYNAEVGSDVVGIGTTFTTPIITQTTSYWVSEAFLGENISYGQANPGPSTQQSYTQNNRGVIFEIVKPITILDVQLFVTGDAGDVTIELLDAAGNAMATTIASVPGGSASTPASVTVPLNFDVNDPTAGPFKLLKVSGPSLMGTASAQASFPYSLGNSGKVTSGALSPTATSPIYHYFYNWTISESNPLCESPRREVIATMGQNYPITVTADDVLVCVGSTTMLYANSADTGYDYTWTWTDPVTGGQIATGNQINVTILENTIFTIKGNNPNTTCEYETSIFIEGIGAIDIPVIPDEIEGCIGEIIQLSAGGVYHDFETTLTDWTVVDNSTYAPGFTPGAAGWKLVNSPHNPADGSTSNDNSQFAISVSNEVGLGGNVNTELISPSFNLVGVQNASLSFYHYYKRISTHPTSARVQVSESGGTWTDLQVFLANNFDYGSPTNFDHVTIDLNNYTGSADVRIRFLYTGGWGWWWAIDNITISRDYINGQVLWDDGNTPPQNLYLNSEATVPYISGSANTVYFKSAVSGDFTYSVSLDVIGCNVITNQVLVKVNETLPPTGDANQIYSTGQTLANLNATGENLKWYMKQNGNFVKVSPNTLIVHGTTYYVTQTQNNCESEMLAITVYLDCPEPTDIDINVELSVDGTTASAVVFWTKPENTSEIDWYYISIMDSNGDIVFDYMISAMVNYKIVEGLALNETFQMELYSVCDPNIPVFSIVETIPFNTEALSTENLDFNGFTYYPNPTQNMVTFENFLPIAQLEIYTITGQKIFEKHNINDTRIQVNFTDMASGVYFTVITVGESVQVVRIIRE